MPGTESSYHPSLVDDLSIQSVQRSRFQSKHNRKYWSCIPFAAIGLGATSYLGNTRFTRPTKMIDYVKWLEESEKNLQHFADEIGVSSIGMDMNIGMGTEGVPQPPDILDVVMCALRTSEGLNVEQIRRIYGEKIVNKIMKCLSLYIEQGLVLINTLNRSNHVVSRIRLKDPEGFLLSNTIISDIFAALSK